MHYTQVWHSRRATKLRWQFASALLDHTEDVDKLFGPMAAVMKRCQHFLLQSKGRGYLGDIIFKKTVVRQCTVYLYLYILYIYIELY